MERDRQEQEQGAAKEGAGTADAHGITCADGTAAAANGITAADDAITAAAETARVEGVAAPPADVDTFAGSNHLTCSS